jgi:hypothetical protein
MNGPNRRPSPPKPAVRQTTAQIRAPVRGRIIVLHNYPVAPVRAHVRRAAATATRKPS